ncbi:MAG TPA: helix-turn-helix domain-containing protein [Herpetosiphonaceae bacterium]
MEESAKPVIATLPFHLPADDTLPFEIGRLETTHSLRSAARPHRHRFYEIIWVQDGSGLHTIDFQDHPIGPRSLFLLSPGQVHAVRIDAPLAGFLILFTADFLGLDATQPRLLAALPFFRAGLVNPVLTLTASEAANLQHCIEHLEAEFGTMAPARPEMLRAYLQILVLTISRLVSARQPAATSAPTPVQQQFDQLIEQHYRRTMRVADYADMLALTPGHLNDLVKDASGQTASARIAERVMLEARRLLAHSDRQVAQIAADLGFDDPAYFGRFFRRHTGKTPGQFRAAIREKYQTGR